MNRTRSEHVGAARKLLRTMSSAPDPRARASEIFRELDRVEDPSTAEHAALSEMRAWLGERPTTGQLKARCETLVKHFL